MNNMTQTTAETNLENPEFRGADSRSRIEQLNLCFATQYRPRRRRNRRQDVLRSQAAFWFETMRRIVDSAVEWKPAMLARPEQTSLDLRRATEVHLAK